MDRTEGTLCSVGNSEECYDDGAAKRPVANPPGESNLGEQGTIESQSAATKAPLVQYKVTGSSSDNDYEAYRLQALQQADSQRSLVAVGLAEDKDRKMAAVSNAQRPSAMNSYSGTALPSSTAQNLYSDGLSKDLQLQRSGTNHAHIAHSLQDYDRLNNFRLQQQMLLYQRQQQERLFHPTISSVYPQGMAFLKR